MNRMFKWLLWPSTISRRRWLSAFSFVWRSKICSSQYIPIFSPLLRCSKVRNLIPIIKIIKPGIYYCARFAFINKHRGNTSAQIAGIRVINSRLSSWLAPINYFIRSCARGITRLVFLDTPTRKPFSSKFHVFLGRIWNLSVKVTWPRVTWPPT